MDERDIVCVFVLVNFSGPRRTHGPITSGVKTSEAHCEVKVITGSCYRALCDVFGYMYHDPDR